MSEKKSGRFVIKVPMSEEKNGEILKLHPLANFDHWSSAAGYADMACRTNLIIVDTEDRDEGDHDWDRWRKKALEAGVEDVLAWLGRDIYRVSYERCWPTDIMRECGWADEGERMIKYALSDPQGARRRWQYLLSEKWLD